MSAMTFSFVKLKYIKMTARKLRLVVDVIRDHSVNEAFSLLNVQNKKAAFYVRHALKSAVANVQNGKDTLVVDVDSLFIKEIMVNEGPTLKRWTPRAMGKASPILKRTSHLYLRLEVLERNK